MHRRSTFIATLAAAATPRAALAADTVKVGTAGLVSDAPLFIADARGYYKEQNLTVELNNLESGAKMIAPLGTGEIDAGAGAPSVALYNAVLRGISIRVVADKGRLLPGYGYNPLLVRKDLMTSGKVKTYRDLRGLKFGMAAVGAAADCTLNAALQRGGLQWDDVQFATMPFPSMPGAFANGAIDAAIVSEPIATEALRQGVALTLATSDKIYPNQQIAVLVYGSAFIANRPDVAKRFMVAYLKAIRFYYGALKNGHFAGPNAPAVVSILQQYTALKDPATYAAMIPAGIDRNGYVNVASMNADIAFWEGRKLIEGHITAEQVVDLSFVRNANAAIG